MIQQPHFWACEQKNQTQSVEETFVQWTMLPAEVSVTAKMQEQLKYPLADEWIRVTWFTRAKKILPCHNTDEH
jgi:hypothetical protein